MTVVSIKFKGRGKTYFFDPNDLTVNEGEQVVVETSKGLELAVCVQGNHEINDERIVPPLRPVVRIATADDLRIAELCKAREKEAFGIAEEKIAAHGLDMKLVDVECNFEGSKILFFFTSDGRVDFRELVKDLASLFHTRIELRQIGVRDEAKMLGGLGICGLPFCCHQFMDDFQPVSTKMAKTQSMSLNPVKISGTCGRLMCCLRYEQEAYEDLVKHVPRNGAFVQTVDGYGSVTLVNLLRQSVKVRLDGTGDDTVRTYTVDQIAEVPGGRPPEGEPLPQVLHYVPKPKEEPEADQWSMPQLIPEDYTEPAPAAPAAQPEASAPQTVKKSSSRRKRSKSAGRDRETPRQDKPKAAEAAAKPVRKAAAAQPHQGTQPRQSGEHTSSRRSRSRRNKPHRTERSTEQ